MSRYRITDERRISILDLARATPDFAVIAGFIDNLTFYHTFGHNSAVGSSVETIWSEGGIYVYPSSASTMTVSSANANDTSAGTGAQTVEVEGLDSSYNEIGETIVMNGQTGVNSVHSYLRVFKIRVITAGSGLQNAGIVYMGTGSITTGKPATVFNLIEAGLNSSLVGVWTVPNGHRAYLREYEFGSSVAKAVTVSLHSKEPGEVLHIEDYRQLIDGTTEEFNFTHVLEPKTDVELRAVTGAGGGDVSGSMEFWIEHLLE